MAWGRGHFTTAKASKASVGLFGVSAKQDKCGSACEGSWKKPYIEAESLVSTGTSPASMVRFLKFWVVA